MVDIVCTHYQHPHVDQRRALPFSHGCEAMVLGMSVPAV